MLKLRDIRVGDQLRCVNAFEDEDNPFELFGVYAVDAVFSLSSNDSGVYLVTDTTAGGEPLIWWVALENLWHFELVATEAQLSTAPTQPVEPVIVQGTCEATQVRSQRHNSGKGEHDYLLTYPSGVNAAFDESFVFFDTLQMLSEWYMGRKSMDHVIAELRSECKAHDIDIASALAETNARAADSAKYEQGNYLHGGNYRQYCQSAVRHALDLQKGNKYDSEGNNHYGAFGFNLLALDMCVQLGLGEDDRIRAPKVG